MSLGVALFVFYGLFTPFWFGLRSLAWLAEFRARRRYLSSIRLFSDPISPRR